MSPITHIIGINWGFDNLVGISNIKRRKKEKVILIQSYNIFIIKLSNILAVCKQLKNVVFLADHYFDFVKDLFKSK